MPEMKAATLQPRDLQLLQQVFGDRLQVNIPLGRFTAARVGGPADALLPVHSSAELAEAVSLVCRLGLPYLILGGGSNVLVSDAGVRGVVLLNRARAVRFDLRAEPPTVWVESGVNFGNLARQAASRGLSGLEWAAGIPGTVGGAVVGNAGAHGGEMSKNLRLAEILHLKLNHEQDRPRRESWTAEQFEFDYRISRLKRNPNEAIVLNALLQLYSSTPEAVQAKLDQYVAFRRRTQPPGASMGSMFKNPPGDYAGRLIEAAGVKGARAGLAEISKLHANFFLNLGGATAADVYALIQLARQAVAKTSGVELELEIEFVGDWEEVN